MIRLTREARNVQIVIRMRAPTRTSLGSLWPMAIALAFAVLGAGSAKRVRRMDRSERVCDAAQRTAVVVVIDGARWQDVIADGEHAMPRMTSLARSHGAVLGAPGHGAEMRASGPNFVSLPGYDEILTGRPPTSCASNDCAPITIDTIADDVRDACDSSSDGAVFASWPEIDRAATAFPGSIVMSTGRTHRSHEDILETDAELASMLDRASRADARPGLGDYRPDRLTAPIATRYLEAMRPRFMFLSLGDTDEYAHQGDHDGYVAALHRADDVIADIARVLDGMREDGRETLLLVTADHGRADDFRDHGGAFPESSRVWLVAIGESFHARSAIDAPVVHHLADVAPTVREWLGLPRDESNVAGQPMRELLR